MASATACTVTNVIPSSPSSFLFYRQNLRPHRLMVWFPIKHPRSSIVASATPQEKDGSSPLDISHEVIYPPSTMRTLRQILDTVIQIFADTIPFTGSSCVTVGGMREPRDVMENENEVKMRFDMPGLLKEEVEVSLDDNELVIKVEHKKEVGSAGNGSWWRGGGMSPYNIRMPLPDNCEKDKMKAELMDGVLLVTIPKNKLQRKVIDIKIQ